MSTNKGTTKKMQQVLDLIQHGWELRIVRDQRGEIVHARLVKVGQRAWYFTPQIRALESRGMLEGLPVRPAPYE